MKKVLIALALISMFSIGTSSLASAAIKSGSKCKTKNEVAYSGNMKFTCIKSSGKVVWNKGVLVANNASVAGDEIESLPIDPTASLTVDLKGVGQGKGLTYVPFGWSSGERGEGAIGSGGINPQPVLYAPLGTDVLAIKTGTVIKITKLWSKDYNIMIAAKNDQKNVWEVEHVIDVKVKEGEQVKAGQPIAKVSDFDTRYHPGIGLVEFGLLINSSGPPSHICPFKKIASSAKNRITSELTAIFEADKKRGYDSGPMVVIGCTALVSVEG
jgi:hypothetical protein